jgi:tissue factor pathway inhibitor
VTKCKCSSKTQSKYVVNSRGCLSCLCIDMNAESKSACSLPKDVGPCKAINKRYHYDNETKTCKPFLYGGCGGNSNKFLTKELCEQSCNFDVRGRESDMKTQESLKADTCQQDVVVGPCRGAMPRFFFNRTSLKCESFLYGSFSIKYMMIL